MHAIRTMTIADYDVVPELMQQTPGISLRAVDSRQSTARYLDRNSGLSFVCEADQQLVGCIMSGHDGRRGCWMTYPSFQFRHRKFTAAPNELLPIDSAR